MSLEQSLAFRLSALASTITGASAIYAGAVSTYARVVVTDATVAEKLEDVFDPAFGVSVLLTVLFGLVAYASRPRGGA